MNDTASGRPVRFFALVMAGWIVIRLASPGGDIWGEPIDKHPLRPARPKIWPASARKDKLLHWQTLVDQGPMPVPAGQHGGLQTVGPGRAIRTIPAFMHMAAKASAIPAGTMRAEDRAATAAQAINPALATPLVPPHAAGADRWRASAWLLWRDGSATRADAIAGGRLGGSQAGVRIDFDLTPLASSRATAYARASAALNRPASPEAALGLSWQPARAVPISLAAERRIALGKGGRNANALIVVGGFGPKPIVSSLEIEAYAQGGMVGFRSNDFFVDGKMSLLSPISHSPLRIGASLSGGAQPQVERLDIGPELQVRLPFRPVSARLGIEWRERIGGRAAPASGLAVTLGADF
ncbi:hypothetical protein [Sphingobium sp.]|uniref:hypothetical protein n=1 Tax=Sphingobium sp. TaxID=1912891 RepID=UPI0028BE6ABA|nr:hypothetical protein [Sphingobium sp.]